MKVGVVRGDLSEREHLIRLVKERLGWEVVWSVGSGLEASQRCRKQIPDLILMAIRLSGQQDGVEATKAIMKEYDCTIVIVSYIERYNTSIFKALSAGAIDAVEMPSRESDSISTFVRKMRKLKTVTQEKALKNASKGFSPGRGSLQGGKSRFSADLPDFLIAIGCSTGGPGAVALLLSELPENSQVAVVIVQHMDEEYASGMAEWLDSQIPMRTRTIHGGEKPEAGTVFLAKTNDHLVMDASGSLIYTRDPVDNPYRPSVDEFFCSAAQHWQHDMAAVLLTGMGRDGGRGLLALRRLGRYTFAQNQASCAVYGMPQDAAQRGAADEILEPQQIGRRLKEMIKPSHRKREIHGGKARGNG